MTTMTSKQREEYRRSLAAEWQRLDDLRREKLTIWLSRHDQAARDAASDLDIYQREIERELAALEEGR